VRHRGGAVVDTSEFNLTCPKCGEAMRAMPYSEWHLWEVRTVDYICPNCLHVEQVREIMVKRARRGDGFR